MKRRRPWLLFLAGICLATATVPSGYCERFLPPASRYSPASLPEQTPWLRPEANQPQSPSFTPRPQSGRPEFPGSLDRKIIETIGQIEKTRIKYNEEAGEAPYFELIRGKIPIIVSAPHGAKHYRSRGNYWKEEEVYTAALAIILGQITGAHVIYTKNKTREDPNNDLNTKYKEALRKAISDYGIKFLIDLHGARSQQPFKVDLGILSNKIGNSSCPTYKEILEKNFAGFQKEIFNQKFTANDRCTITSFARKEMKIEAFQMEINARLRKSAAKIEPSNGDGGRNRALRGEEKEFLDLIARLARIIRDIDRKI